MKRISMGQLKEEFYTHNRRLGLGVGDQFNKLGIYGVIVYSQDSFTQPYTEEARSYRVISTNKAFLDGMCGNSIYGDCLDGSEYGVRLDLVGWKVDYCYLLDGDCGLGY